MRTDMTAYKMIYKNGVYNCISLMPCILELQDNSLELMELDVVYLDSDNRVKVVRDKSEEFQFVSR